jgi:poly(3-hydroxybutyrate) depolymerase
MKLLLLVLASLLLTGMASTPPPRAQMLTDQWINVVDPVLNPSGLHVIARHYKLWDGRANCAIGQTARLVIAIHGGHGSPADFSQKFTPQGCYVVAYPAGSNKILGQIRVSGSNLSWNTSSAYEAGQGWAGESGVSDDLFLTNLVNKLKADFALTTVFAAGHSRGGIMTYHLACDTGLFSAIATVGTTLSDATCSRLGSVPNIHVHGLNDTLMCWTASGGDCVPWAPARPGVFQWQGIVPGPGHERHLIANGEHAWDSMPGFDTTGNVWRFFDAK